MSWSVTTSSGTFTRFAQALSLAAFGASFACSTSSAPPSDAAPPPPPSSSAAAVAASAPEALRATCEAARARADAALGGRAAPLGRCFAAGNGAWLLDLEPGAPGDALGITPGDHLVFPTFVTAEGRAVRAAAPLPRMAKTPRDKLDGSTHVGPLVDLDGDGAPDLQLTLEWVDIRDSIGTSEKRSFAFAFRGDHLVSLDVPAR